MLDANVLVHVANDVPGAARIAAKLSEHLHEIHLSAVTAYELHYKVGKARASRVRVLALAR
jgi:predicted nucleic acid-binding protein